MTEDLQKQISQAIADNNSNEVERLAELIVKSKTSRHKAEADALKVEAEAMSSDREKLAIVIHEAVVKLNLKQQLDALKATGFTFKLNTEEIQYKSVSLTVANVKSSTKSSNVTAGKTKDEYGMSLGELFDKYATDKEKQSLADADTNSKKWQVKNSVKKRLVDASELVAK